MDSWTIQGDRYTFLRSAPRTFSLCHRDGTPNHVEIFDIINVPTQRSSISETTCLCDIFGDDCESPSLSSSPAAAVFVPAQRAVENTAAASPLLDDVNDSSGSYHTAQGFSEEEEGFEESGEKLSSPTLEDKREPEGIGSKSPSLQFASPSPGLSSGGRTPSPGPNSLNTSGLGGRLSSLSSSSAEKRLSRKHSEAEPRTISHSSKVRDTNNQSLTSSLSPCKDLLEPTQSLPNENMSPSSDLIHCSPGFTDSDLKSGSILSCPSPSLSGTEIVFHSSPVDSEFRNSSPFTDTQVSPSFPELGGRVSLPDLFSRDSSPELKDPSCSPEISSDLSSAGRNPTITPESQKARLSVEQESNAYTPGPRYTPPSPVISTATSAELGEGTFSPELRHISESPRLLSPTSSAKTRTRTPSPEPAAVRNSFSDLETQMSSPVVDYSLSPSPGVRDNSFPLDYRYTSTSPEIRITASSPEAGWKEQTKDQPTSASPESGPHFGSNSPRSFTSSSHIMEISYSAAQLEDRDSPPFPELSHLSASEPDITLMSGRNSVDNKAAESAATPASDLSGSLPPSNMTQMLQTRYQTPSPTSNGLTRSPEGRFQTCLSNKLQSPSPQLRSRDQSPVSPLPEEKYQNSAEILSTDYSSVYAQATQRNKPEVLPDSISPDFTEKQNLARSEKDSQSPSFETDRRDKAVLEGLNNYSPIISDKVLVGSPIQHLTEREKLAAENDALDKLNTASFPDKNLRNLSPLSCDKDTNSSIEIKSTSSNPVISKDSSPNVSPLHQVSSSPCQQNPVPQSTSHPQTPNGNISPSKCMPEAWRRQPIKKLIHENRERSTEDVSHRINRRQTPSPPLTRFTPVHIIAPQKPCRHWQKRSKSPSHVLPPSSGGNLKKATANKEGPGIDPADNNSQTDSVGLGRQLEMEREMSLEQEGAESMERQRKREEREPERGEGWQGVASYRGEQVELSFSARNRKGPVSWSAAPTSRKTRQGLPTAHSCSESLLATRQTQQQQQGLLKPNSQRDIRGGSARGRIQPPATQNRKSAPGREAADKPCQSSSSSMGSELDEADSEVKWFTDFASRSLSSSEVDYLDMYNSSCRSSTNVSQPSTQESPAGVNPAWMAYADFRGSAPKLDCEEPSSQQSPAYNLDCLDPSRRYELGSFECIDVAVEREDHRQVRRGVPKRQIQLKRRNNGEGKRGESSENSSPGLPTTMESPSQETQLRRSFIRQHSTPAAIQECCPSGNSPESTQQKERQSKFQKSASMDETSSKTKMASCLIKSVLSKKMQGVDRHPDEQTGEGRSPPTEMAKESLKLDSHDLPSNLQTNYNFSSEGHSMREEVSAKDEAKPPKSQGLRPSNRPSSSSSSGRSVAFSQTDSEDTDSQSRNSTPLRSEMKSELKVMLDSKQSKTGLHHSKASERDAGDATARDTGNSSTKGGSNKPVRMTDREQESENAGDPKQLHQCDRSTNSPKIQDITLKAVEKRKTSLGVCLTPEAESKPFSPDLPVKEARIESDEKEKTGDNVEENNGVKAPIHVVRDVRRLVKNTYNLSFKAADGARPSSSNDGGIESLSEKRGTNVTSVEEKDVKNDTTREEREEEKKEETKDLRMQTSSPLGKSKGNAQPIQIECKAVCWKNDKNKMASITKDTGNKSHVSSKSVTEVNREPRNPIKSTSNFSAGQKQTSKLCEQDKSVTTETQKAGKEIPKLQENKDKSVETRAEKKPPMLGNLPKLPSKEREVSTAVVLIREKTNKSSTSPSPAQVENTASGQDSVPSSLSPGSTTPGSRPGSGGHSVSMLLKEKGYQADIGAVVNDNHNTAGGKGLPRKHVNSLEIPLQTAPPADGGLVDVPRDRKLSSSSPSSGPSAATDTSEALTQLREDVGLSIKPPGKDPTKLKSSAQEHKPPPSKQKDVGDFETVKRLDPTFPPRSPAIRKFKPQPIEVKSLSKEPQKPEMPTNSMTNQRPQAIEVKSVAKNSQKPVVPPKPSCKFKPADLGTNEPHTASAPSSSSTGKQLSEEKTQTIVVSSPTIYRKISNDSTSSSNYSRKLAVSAVSSCKPPAPKMAAATIGSFSSQLLDTEASTERGQQQAALPQSSNHVQKPLPTRVEGLDEISTSALASDPKPDQAPESTFARANQATLMSSDNQKQLPRMTRPPEQAKAVTPNNAKQSSGVSSSQVPRYTHQPYHPSVPSECTQQTEDLQFFASDDPPSYEERESFSPLLLPDLAPQRPNRCQPSTRAPPCSCSTSCPSHPSLAPLHHHHSPHNLTPPAPTHSPGQALPYQVNQPPLRPHQCRPEPHPMSYQPSSPKSSSLCLNQPPSMYHPPYQPAPCPPHPSLMPACPAERPLQPPQHIDPRRPPVHKSPHQQQQPPNIAGAPYSDPGHGHSPGLPPVDTQYLCGPQSMGPSFGSDYGGDASSLYSESNYGQTPRRVLLDPETGKYFYIEVPVQPLRKMLFDPETGQYVEVLIPQQTMSHSGLYPPSAAPFSPLHTPNMYAPAPQYMPCAAPPPLAHPQVQPQPPRYPEQSAATAMHMTAPGVSYRNPSGQGSKPEHQNHPPLDHSYLESMYYVPTGMNASPNPTPPDYYHKHPSNLAPSGGKRA